MAMRRRRSPGLVNTVARTAVVAGTATVVAGGVAGKQQQKAQAQAQQVAAQQAANESQQQIAEMQAQMANMQAQQASAAMLEHAAPTSSAGEDMMTQLMQLAEMKGAGLLSDEEFAAAKARLLSN